MTACGRCPAFVLLRAWAKISCEVHFCPDECRKLRIALLRLAHKGQRRKSGEPYIVHPVAVAELLALLKAWSRDFDVSFWILEALSGAGGCHHQRAVAELHQCQSCGIMHDDLEHLMRHRAGE